VLDSTLCLSYWTQAPESIPERFRAELGSMVYGCDICQDVCPWNHPIAKRMADAPLNEDATPNVSLRDWLDRDGADLVAEFDRLYVPRKDPRWLRRNALIAAGNGGSQALVPVVSEHAESEDGVIRETAIWALARMGARRP
jgi:epoxyqueuosine reductase